MTQLLKNGIIWGSTRGFSGDLLMTKQTSLMSFIDHFDAEDLKIG